MSLIGRVRGGIKWTGVSAAIRALCQFVQIFVLAQFLSPEQLGLAALASLALLFGQAFADMGFSNAIIHYQETSRERLSTLYVANIIMGLVVGTIVLLIAPAISALYAAPALQGLLSLAALVFVLASFGQQFQVLLQKDLAFQRLSYLEIAVAIVGLFIVTISAVFGAGAYSLVIGQIGRSALLSTGLMHWGFKHHRPLVRFSPSDLKGYVAFGCYQMGQRLLTLTGSNVDRLIIGATLGAEALGYYHLAQRLMQAPTQLFSPILNRVAFPVFAIIKNESERIENAYLEITVLIAFMLFPVYVGLSITSHELIESFFGSKWVSATDVLVPLSFVAIFFTLGGPFGNLLLAKGRADVGFYLNGFRLILLTTAVLLASGFGLASVAWAVLGVIGLVMFPLGLLIRAKLFGQSPVAFLLSLWPPACCSAIMGIGCITYKEIIGPSINSMSTLIGTVCFGVAVYAMTLVFGRRKYLRALEQRRRA